MRLRSRLSGHFIATEFVEAKRCGGERLMAKNLSLIKLSPSRSSCRRAPAAHKRIIHRDINRKTSCLSPDGYVKVLPCLAKLVASKLPAPSKRRRAGIQVLSPGGDGHRPIYVAEHCATCGGRAHGDLESGLCAARDGPGASGPSPGATPAIPIGQKS